MKTKRKYQTVSSNKEPKPIQTQNLARVRVGDNVYRQPISFSDGNDKNARTMRGTVVWVHPTGRFHVVEFENGVRESFAGVYR